MHIPLHTCGSRSDVFTSAGHGSVQTETKPPVFIYVYHSWYPQQLKCIIKVSMKMSTSSQEFKSTQHVCV